MQNFCHWAAGDVGALFGEAAVGEVAAGVLAVAEVYIGYDVDYASVCLFRGGTRPCSGFLLPCGRLECGGVWPLLQRGMSWCRRG